MKPLRAIKSVAFLENILHFPNRNVRAMYGPISNLNILSKQMYIKYQSVVKLQARCLLCSWIDGFVGRRALNISKYPPYARDKVNRVTSWLRVTPYHHQEQRGQHARLKQIVC